MDPKFLKELQKLKEEKNADLEKVDLGELSIPDFEDVEVPEDKLGAEIEEEISGGTIQFKPVTKTEPESTPSLSGGRHARKPEHPEIDDETKKQRAKILKIVLISSASLVAFVAVLFTVFFGIRNANMKKYTYQYLGMGAAIENGVKDYSFFGNLKTITQYGESGLISAVAEFKNGNCVKETVYDSDGTVDCYFTHEYEEKYRILTSCHRDGQMVQSVKYSLTEEGKIQAEYTYYLENNRTELAVITLSESGNVLSAEYYSEAVVTHRNVYSGTLITETIYYDDANTVASRIVYEYNGAKQLLTQTEYDSKNSIQRRIVNQYSEKNHLTKTIQYDGTGAILEYNTYNYDLNDNPIKQVTYAGDGSIKRQTLKVFNDKNQIIKETNLNADGSISYCYGYDYDEKGYITKSIVYSTQNSATIEKYTLFVRKEDGTVSESTVHNSANVLIEKSKFNDAGFLTELYKFNDAGTLILEQKLKYDKKQRMTEKSVTNFSDTGEKTDHCSEQYNDKGLVTMKINEITAENRYEQYLFAYHKDGWKKQETLFDQSGKEVYDRTLNEKGQISSETLYENGQKAFFNEYTYNDKNQVLIKRSMNNATNTLTKTSYTYDENGVLSESLDTNILDTPIVKKQYAPTGLVSAQTNYDNEGKIESYNSFEYDELSRVIVKETYGEDKKMVSKTVYYYREGGGYDYTIYDENGIAIEDSRGTEYLPDNEDETLPPSEDSTDTEDYTTSSSESSVQDSTSDSTSENETTDASTDLMDSSTETATQNSASATDQNSEISNVSETAINSSDSVTETTDTSTDSGTENS